MGQLLLGQTKKGILLLLGGTIISICTCGIAAIDGYITANKIKNGQQVEDMHFF